MKKRVGTPDRIEIRDDISGLIESYDVDILIVNRFLLFFFVRNSQQIKILI